MAADMVLQVLVSPLLGTVFNNLSSLIQSEFGQVWGVDKELEEISQTMSTIQDVMEDAEEKQLENKPINNWLKRLKQVVYDAEDVLEEFAIEDALRRDRQSEILETNNTCNNIQVLTDSVSSCFDFKHVLFRRKTAKKIKDLKEKFDKISKDKSNFHLNLNAVKRDVRFAQTSSIPLETQIYGRDEDKEQLVNLLLNNIELDVACQTGEVSICIIHGMGGLGKTTLAQMVYSDERIVKHFEVKCWVCVSENFEPITLIKAIIESSGGSANDLQDLDPLQRRLQGILSGKRFLVVLDDVWNEDQAKWDVLKSSLRCGDKGSSVLVTTRLRTVGMMMSTLHMYSPTILSDDDCWSLFKHRAFGITNNEVLNHPNLEAIGKEIVKKCKGIPLAAKALGGLLRFKREENEWIFIRDSEVWTLPQHTQDAILPALKLSYNQLPSNLKQCFAYCSIFPKDHRINKNELINLWIANGFVQSKGESMDSEDVGNEIFNYLLWRSFFQNIEKDEFDNINWCMMHDLVHDLACSVMGDECSVVKVGIVVNGGRNTGTSTTRHLSFYSSYSLSPILNESSLPNTVTHIRTFLLLRSYACPSIKLFISLQLIFSNMKWLRILDLSETDIKTVPNSICNLKHLRYLNLSHTKITSLPNKSFCSLRNLQILRLGGCRKLQMLPKDLRKMNCLIHLEIWGCDALSRMPTGMGRLSCLRSLSDFIVGPKIGYGIEELQGQDHLRGGLRIRGMEHVRNVNNARNANLMKKHNLTSLELVWGTENNNINEEDEELLLRVIQGLQPHPNLKMFGIKGYQGAKFPCWMMGFQSSLPNLVKIELYGCTRCEHLPSLGELRLLKYLTITGMDSVKYIGDEFYCNGDSDSHHHHQGYFPSLKKLYISDMKNLEEWSSPSSSSNREIIEGGEVLLAIFPCLKELEIYSCPKFRSWPSFPPSLETLTIHGCQEVILGSSFENLPPCLTSLSIGGFEEMIDFPHLEEGTMVRLRNLTSLNSLTIYSCPKLRNLPKMLMENLTAISKFGIDRCVALVSLLEGGIMQNIKSLKELDISNCNSLKTLGEGFKQLTTLERLAIESCPELEFLADEFLHLIALRDLYLDKLPKMTSLPNLNTQHLGSTLDWLNISDCSSLTTLPGWVTNLTSLRHLIIEHCENLKLFPDGLQRLTALNFLEIRGCHPDLHNQLERYKQDNSHQIAHIHKFINEPK